ncbi:putative bifunctional diguanylate cyclase/phosphodiesterase [Chitinibacteraceae bacterium HSL-7]
MALLLGLITGVVLALFVILPVSARYRRDLRRVETLLDSIPDLAWVKDRQSRFVVVNDAFCRVWGIRDKREVLGRDDFALSPPELAQRYQDDDRNVMRSRQMIRIENDFEHVTDGHRWMELIKAPVFDRGDVIGTAGIARDISERKAAEAQLMWLAGHDPLTQLGNRRQLDDVLNTWLAEHRPFTLWLIDLDHFKRINDALGHRAGDSALTTLGERLAKLPAPAFRLGGDEFVVVSDAQDDGEVEAAIEACFAEQVDISGLDFTLGFTAGRVNAPFDGEQSGQLLKHADIALYEGKRNGRGQIRSFVAEMATQAARQLALERDIRHGLASRQFRLVFQPQVDITTGQLNGFEALIRWRHPERGEIRPMEFIPFAEQTGIICTIGDWVIDEALRILAQWGKAGLAVVPVSVNVTALQLEQNHFAEDVIARRNVLPPSLRNLLALELTESCLMDGTALATVHKLRDAHIALYMDDFGTGYSNLAMLSQLSLSKIKFDRSLIADIGGSSARQRVCRALLDLAQALGLGVVAEGVETSEEADWLAQQGVTEAQGFLFGAALELDAATRLLHRGFVTGRKPDERVE